MRTDTHTQAESYALRGERLDHARMHANQMHHLAGIARGIDAVVAERPEASSAEVLACAGALVTLTAGMAELANSEHELIEESDAQSMPVPSIALDPRWLHDHLCIVMRRLEITRPLFRAIADSEWASTRAPESRAVHGMAVAAVRLIDTDHNDADCDREQALQDVVQRAPLQH